MLAPQPELTTSWEGRGTDDMPGLCLDPRDRRLLRKIVVLFRPPQRFGQAEVQHLYCLGV
jgi:hypothetical protein